MITAAIIGAAGYTGGELLRLLLRHPDVGSQNITAVSASFAGSKVEVAHADLAGDASLTFASSYQHADVVFLCQGHGNARTWMAENAVAPTTKVIDLSIDHRNDAAWTYGLPELHRDAIRASSRVANPGCFATTVELALMPMKGALRSTVYVTALTGSTGAGQAPSETTHFSWRSNNVGVYKAFNHQHLPEIERVIGTSDVVFVPMRGSWTRGILASCIVRTDLPFATVLDRYHTAYAEHPFTHVVDDLPDIKRVVGTNKCLIGLQHNGDHVLVVSVTDNLLKGASGQAVQNMNLMCGFHETAGLLLKSAAY